MALGKKKILHQAADTGVVNTENFDIVTYSGTNSSQSITSLDFQPDLIWFKNRTGTNAHALVDSVRGRDKYLFSNLTNAEPSSSAAGQDLISFNSNGFTVGTVNNAGSTNTNGGSIVAWCFKGGGTAVTDSSADITADISANTDAGFSIVKYTGNGSTNQTIPHGLNSSPTLIITKCLNDATKWWGVNSTSLTTNTLLRLDSTSAEISDSGNYITMGNTSTFTVQDGSIINGSLNYIAYCFHSVDGYQKIGSYTGNTTTRPSVNTGFRPRFLMIKDTDSTSAWTMLDSARNTSNPVNARLKANENSEESTLYNVVNFTNTGFDIISDDNEWNDNGNTFIYLAIA